MSKHTPGPFRFVQQAEWPYSLSIYGGSPEYALIGAPMPAHSSADKSVDDAINAVNFHKNERAHAAQMNAKMIANFRLWAAAPDLLRALKVLLADMETAFPALASAGLGPMERARDAISKAEGPDEVEEQVRA